MRLVKLLLAGLMVVGALLVGVVVAAVVAAASVGRSLRRRFGSAPLTPPQAPRRARSVRPAGNDDVIDITAREVPGDTSKS